jgi:hypothetical protein
MCERAHDWHNTGNYAALIMVNYEAIVAQRIYARQFQYIRPVRINRSLPADVMKSIAAAAVADK